MSKIIDLAGAGHEIDDVLAFKAKERSIDFRLLVGGDDLAI